MRKAVDNETKDLSVAVLSFLKEQGHESSALALVKELKRVYGKHVDLTSTHTLTLVKKDASSKKRKKATESNDASKDSSSESSSSSSGSSSDGKKKKTAKTVQAEEAKQKSDTSDSSSSSSSSSSSDSDSSDDKAGSQKKSAAAISRKAKQVATKKDDSSSDSSSVSSSDSSDDEKKAIPLKKAHSQKKKSDRSSSSDSSDQDNTKSKRTIKNSTKGDHKSSVNKKIKEPISEKARTKQLVVSPDDESEVSDVEVSDVSSVEDVSSSSDDDDSSSSDSSSSEDEEEEDAAELLKQKKALAKKRAQEAAKAALEWKPSAVAATPTKIETRAGTDGAQALNKGKPFQRVDSEHWGTLASQEGGAVADNSYEGAFGSSGFGAKSSEKLLQTRGKDFRHEKTKRKRTFNGFSRTGGQINTDKSYSTKYEYSDDE
jgi:hypothetical protein